MELFTSPEACAQRIKKYFRYIEGEYHLENVPGKAAKEKTELTSQKIWDREAEPATLTGLALFLGFNSLHDLEKYLIEGVYAEQIKRGVLRIEAEYEKKLHYQSSAGAIFALKSMGWAERADGSLFKDLPTSLYIEIIEAGPKLSGTEKEVNLD